MLFRALAQQFSGLGQRFAGIGRGQQDPTSGFRRLLSNLSASKLLGSGRPGAHLFGRKALAAGSTGHMHSIPSTFPIHSSFLTTASAATVLTGMQEMGIWGWLLVDLALNWGGWAVAAVLKTEKFYDLVGSLSFLSLTAGSLALSGVAPRKILVSCMVGVWALRLGSYLVMRVMKVGHDSRFDKVKHQPGMFLFYWTMQAIWVWVTLTPVLIINTAASATPLRWFDILGAVIWGVGLGIEAVSDAQKDAWRAKPENKGKFINEGLWATSRHPNYFGEMVLWWGVFFTCVGGFSHPAHYASIASPVVVMLLLRYVSGVPILERQADARWGGQPEYEHYKATTPLLIPDLTKLWDKPAP